MAPNAKIKVTPPSSVIQIGYGKVIPRSSALSPPPRARDAPNGPAPASGPPKGQGRSETRYTQTEAQYRRHTQENSTNAPQQRPSANGVNCKQSGLTGSAGAEVRGGYNFIVLESNARWTPAKHTAPSPVNCTRRIGVNYPKRWPTDGPPRKWPPTDPNRYACALAQIAFYPLSAQSD